MAKGTLLKPLATTVLALSIALSAAAQEEQALKINRNGAQASIRGAAANFTGTVRVDMLFNAPAPARVGGGLVTFEPGARTAWHTHPLGQTLLVTQGLGLVQRRGGPVQAIRPGDTVWIPPGVQHWHGASPTHGMSHFAIAEQLDGKSVEWLEQVSESEYAATPR